MAGRWEFPGGKLHKGESQRAALARELAEELGIRVEDARPLIDVHHSYVDRDVVLHAWIVRRYEGAVQSREGQALEWLDATALASADLLEADRPILAALGLPDRYLITGEPQHDTQTFLRRLDHALAGGIALVQLRAPDLPPDALTRLARNAAGRCSARGARLLVNGDPRMMLPLAHAAGAHGVHVPARHLSSIQERALRGGLLVGASCHDARELEAARAADADLCVLGPVLATATHPEAQPLGWTRFASLARGAGLPVYALGGLGSEDLEKAWLAGAQGVAAIRAWWQVET
jgi:8-oxo-dGTP diphosphatase